MTLERLITAIRPNYFMDKFPNKPFQTDDILEGTKSAAIIMLIGLSDLYNIPRKEVMDYLAMDYDEYRNKLHAFRIACQEVVKAEQSELNDRNNHTPLKRFYWKMTLVNNAIRLYNNNQVYTINEIIEL